MVFRGVSAAGAAEWWVRFSLNELLHLLPCSCNPRRGHKETDETDGMNEKNGFNEMKEKNQISEQNEVKKQDESYGRKGYKRNDVGKCGKDLRWHQLSIHRAIEAAGGRAIAEKNEDGIQVISRVTY